MTISVVQKKTALVTAGPAGSFPIALDNPITAGSTVAVFFVASYGGDRLTFTITDENARTFTHIADAYANGGFLNFVDVRAFVYESHPGGDSDLTVTATDTNVEDFTAWAVELASGAGAVTLDDAGFNVQDPSPNTTDGITSGSLTTTVPNAILLGYTFDSDNLTGTLSAGTGFTSAAGDLSDAMARGEHRIVTSAGSAAALFTRSVAGTTLTNALALKEPTATVVSSGTRRLGGVHGARRHGLGRSGGNIFRRPSGLLVPAWV